MKILVATTNGGLEDKIASIFGRAPTFTVVDVDENEIVNTSILPNKFASAVGGAGVQVAQWVLNSGAQAIIAGKFGPNASEIFIKSKIKMLEFEGITVREAVQRCIDGEPTNFAPNDSSAQEYSSGKQTGRGSGRGSGRGMGRDRGMGQGDGRRNGMGVRRFKVAEDHAAFMWKQRSMAHMPEGKDPWF